MLLGITWPEWVVLPEWIVWPNIKVDRNIWFPLVFILAVYAILVMGFVMGYWYGLLRGRKLTIQSARSAADLSPKRNLFKFLRTYESKKRLHDIWIRVLFEHNDALEAMLFRRQLEWADSIRDPSLRVTRLTEITPDFFTQKAASIIVGESQEDQETGPNTPEPAHADTTESAPNNTPESVSNDGSETSEDMGQEAARALDEEDLEGLLKPDYFKAQASKDAKIDPEAAQLANEPMVDSVFLGASWDSLLYEKPTSQSPEHAKPQHTTKDAQPNKPQRKAKTPEQLEKEKIARLAQEPMPRFQKLGTNHAEDDLTEDELRQNEKKQSVARLMEAKVYALNVKQGHQARINEGDLINYLEDTDYETSWEILKNGVVKMDVYLRKEL